MLLSELLNADVVLVNDMVVKLQTKNTLNRQIIEQALNCIARSEPVPEPLKNETVLVANLPTRQQVSVRLSALLDPVYIQEDQTYLVKASRREHGVVDLPVQVCMKACILLPVHVKEGKLSMPDRRFIDRVEE